jgi:hypothetical protein
MKQTFSCRQIELSHEEMLRLRQAGILILGVYSKLAEQISQNHIPRKTMEVIDDRPWNWVIFLGILSIIYFSFTSYLWWFIFIVGCVALGTLVPAQSNSENVLGAALNDKEFYDQIKSLNGWRYFMEEKEADKYRPAIGAAA